MSSESSTETSVQKPLPLTAKRQGIWLEKAFVWLCIVAVSLPLLVLGILLFEAFADGLGRIDLDFLRGATS
ncbi:MAG: hypothetical protein AAGC55_20010, partial [Myxococcota bacterium]